DARFATAQELQLALEDFARQHQLGLSSVALSAYLGELFGDKLAAWHDARRAGRSLTDHVIATATGGTVDLAALDAAAAPGAIAPAEPAVRAEPGEPSRRGASRGPRIGVAAVCAAALGIVSAVWLAQRTPPGVAAVAAPLDPAVGTAATAPL